MLLDPMIPAAERARVVRGSHEVARAALEALVAIDGKTLVASETAPTLVATFATHVVVEADEKLYKIAYKVSEDRYSFVGAAEPVMVQRVSRKQHLETTMYGVVDALLTDQVDEAVGLVKTLLPCLGEVKELLAYTTVAEKVEKLLTRTCPWKTLIESTEPASVVQFKKLYDHSMRPDELPAFLELVQTELTAHSKELESMWTTVVSLESVAKLMSGDEAPKLVNLAEDFARDLGDVRGALDEVTHQVQDVAVLGKVSDLIASRLPSYKAACSKLQLSISR